MELFAVDRYVEEDDEEIQTPDATKVLKRLRKEAIRRRKALEANESIKAAEIETEPTKKNKKRKHDTENGVCETENGIDEEETTPKKKKKKNKKKETETEIVEVNVEKTKRKAKKQKNQNSDRDFMVIGEAMNDEKKAVKRVLPDWLAKPTVFSMNLRDELSEVDSIHGLCPSIVSELRANNITHFFPVQTAVISWLLDSFTKNWIRQPDLCVSSPTGSGKTLAFALPIIHALNTRFVCSIKALIVLPVGDLATQVFEVFRAYTKGTYLTVGLAVGKKVLSEEQYSLVRKGKRGYRSKVDILVCTPGRLIDHLANTPGFTLIDLKFLVIDEADRMMQQVKQDWLNNVEKNVSKGHNELDGNVVTANRMTESRKMPRKLLFSATLSQNPEKLQDIKLFQPKLFTTGGTSEVKTNGIGNGEFVTEFIGRYTTPKELTEFYVVCNLSLKPLIILHFIQDLGYHHMFCFTNSVTSSHRLYMLLSAYGGCRVKEFTSTLTTNQRMETLKDFTRGSIDVIVCSDSLARGMDVENVDYVVSYDLPLHLKSYIHRVGRTARAGRLGTAISLVEKKEESGFHAMMETACKSVKQLKIDMKRLEPMEEQYKQALEQVKTKIDGQRSKQMKNNFKQRSFVPKKKMNNKMK